MMSFLSVNVVVNRYIWKVPMIQLGSSTGQGVLHGNLHTFLTPTYFYDLLKKNNPGVSEIGFLKTLEQMSSAKGRVSNVVNIAS